MKAAMTVASVASTLASAKSLFTPAPKAPRAADTTTTITPMPTEDSQAVQDAKRRALIAQSNRGGRASTVLTDNETFGGN